MAIGTERKSFRQQLIMSGELPNVGAMGSGKTSQRLLTEPGSHSVLRTPQERKVSDPLAQQRRMILNLLGADHTSSRRDVPPSPQLGEPVLKVTYLEGTTPAELARASEETVVFSAPTWQRPISKPTPAENSQAVRHRGLAAHDTLTTDQFVALSMHITRQHRTGADPVALAKQIITDVRDRRIIAQRRAAGK